MNAPGPSGFDFFRLPGRRERGTGFKEWQHFLVHHEEIRLLFNVSLSETAWPLAARGQSLRYRTIVLLTGAAQHELVDSFETGDITAGGRSAVVGNARLDFAQDGYEIEFSCVRSGVSLELTLRPVTTPLFFLDKMLAPGRRWSWFCVPHLRAKGTISAAGRVFDVVDAPAYHDHNWGCFWWGDDFSWDFGSVVPDDRERPAIVYHRLLDRRRRIVRHQSLIAHGQTGFPSLHLNAEVDATDGESSLRPSVFPAPLGLLLPDQPRAPESALIHSRGPLGDFDIQIENRSASRLTLPTETSPDGLIGITETLGRATVTNRRSRCSETWSGQSVMERLEHV